MALVVRHLAAGERVADRELRMRLHRERGAAGIEQSGMLGEIRRQDGPGAGGRRDDLVLVRGGERDALPFDNPVAGVTS